MTAVVVEAHDEWQGRYVRVHGQAPGTSANHGGGAPGHQHVKTPIAKALTPANEPSYTIPRGAILIEAQELMETPILGIGTRKYSDELRERQVRQSVRPKTES
jgi:hypothetical protein